MTKRITKDKDNIEKRMIEIRALDMPADSEKENRVVEGYAATFEGYAEYEAWTCDPEGCEIVNIREYIDKDAFTNADMRDVPMIYNHDRSSKPVARTRANSSAGLLQLLIDTKGLKVRADLIGTQEGKDMYECIRSGLIDKMSFAFSIREGGQKFEKVKGSERDYIRRITDIEKIWDVSAVDFPAYEKTEISARSKNDLEKLVEKPSEPKSSDEQRKKELRQKLSIKLADIE